MGTKLLLQLLLLPLQLPLLLLQQQQAEATPVYQTDQPNLGFVYDYFDDISVPKEEPVAETTTFRPTPPTTPPSDPLEEAREMARLNIMDRILIALGPPFGEKLPKAPVSNTLATVQTPINITTEPCPYKYKRCSSQTYFPSCDIPRNTSPETWAQRFNLFFNMSAADFDNNLDLINATLRLYKNTSLPLMRARSLLVKAFAYTRSLTRRRNKYKLVADTQVSSEYIGWVTLSVTNLIKRWKKKRNNHGVLITVNDIDDTLWDAPRIFATMDCTSGLPPLPFEIQMEQFSQQYPALNIRLGSPDQEPLDTTTTIDNSFASLPKPRPTNLTNDHATTMQADDPVQMDYYDYENDLRDDHEDEILNEDENEGPSRFSLFAQNTFTTERQRQMQDDFFYDLFSQVYVPPSMSPVSSTPVFTLTTPTTTTTTTTAAAATTAASTSTENTTPQLSTTTTRPQPRPPRRTPGRRRGGGRHRRRNKAHRN